jgi:hypothetical protein
MSFEIEADELFEIDNFNNLNYVREAIESMTKFNQVEILRILTKNKNVMINENKYGIHINLSDLKKDLLDELNVYIKYVNTQEVALHQVEKEKETYKNTYFTKDIKDKNKIK